MDDDYDGTGPCPTCGREDAGMQDYLADLAPTTPEAYWRRQLRGWVVDGIEIDDHGYRLDETLPLIGYLVDGALAARPAAPLTLYRGATPENRDNWSWTSNPGAAHTYASGFWVQHEVGLVWRATVEPERLLARLVFDRYDEYIVDTDGLTIEPHQLWCRCPVDLAPFRQDARLALDLHEVVHCTRG